MNLSRRSLLVAALAGILAFGCLTASNRGVTPAVSAQAQSQGQSREEVVVLEGLDPVLLTQGKETPGKPQISITRGSDVYFFSTD
ncbi:MAG: hypothetical protein ABI882_14180 [Acidobacteriota bacterium]